MLRRTKTTLINGKPIVDLPARLVNIVECDFDRVQREFYNSVEQKVADSLEQLQQGDMRKAYTSVLVLLLRLRQGQRRSSSVQVHGLILVNYSVQSPSIDLEGLQER